MCIRDSNNIMIEKDKLNDKKKISVCARKTSMNENNNNNKNSKNIDDDVTSAKSLDGELLIDI